MFSDQTVDLVVTGAGITTGDYSLTDGDGGKAGIQIQIASGSMSGSVTFTATDDGLVEVIETATLTVENPTLSLVLGPTVSRDITIISDDVPGFTVTETNSDTTVTPVKSGFLIIDM